MSLEDNREDRDKIEETKARYKMIGKVAEGVADVTGGIPIVGGIASSVAKGIFHLSENAVNTIQRDNPDKDNWYFALESSNIYNQIYKKVEKIMNDSALKEKHNYTNDDYIIQVWDDFDYRIDNNDPIEETDISYFVSIEFKDDNYSYKDVKDRACSANIQFVEKFKQINFENNKVYSAFEIISHGGSPSPKLRKYIDLSGEIVLRLCNGLC